MLSAWRRRALDRRLQQILKRHDEAVSRDLALAEGFESHQPVLIELLRSIERARALELGLGWGSTPIVLGLSGSSVSLETKEEWFKKFRRLSTPEHEILLWTSYEEFAWVDCPYLEQEWDVALVDNHPSHSRQRNLLQLAERTRFVVCHDTEECFKPSASDYRWDFSSFPHVWTYKRSPTYTTVVSTREPIPVEWLDPA